MGNCTSGTKKKGKGGKSNTDNKPNEDVTYASIDHSTSKGSPRARATTDDDCDYATVNLPAAAPETVSKCSSTEENTDDYVLMG